MMVSVLERILPRSSRDTAKDVFVERRDEALVIARDGVEERIALGEIRLRMARGRPRRRGRLRRAAPSPQRPRRRRARDEPR